MCPREGFKSVTISEDVYELIKRILEREKKTLKRGRIKTASQLVEEAVIEYAETHCKDILEKLVRERD